MRMTAAALAVCSIGFSINSASAAITIQRAQIAGGSLWIGGRIQPRAPRVIVKISPSSSIELNTRPNGTFSWQGKEYPTSCILEVEGGGQSIKALVSGCGPQGPRPDRRARRESRDRQDRRESQDLRDRRGRRTAGQRAAGRGRSAGPWDRLDQRESRDRRTGGSGTSGPREPQDRQDPRERKDQPGHRAWPERADQRGRRA